VVEMRRKRLSSQVRRLKSEIRRLRDELEFEKNLVEAYYTISRRHMKHIYDLERKLKEGRK